MRRFFYPGSHRLDCVNSRTFQGLLKDSSIVFKDYTFIKNTDLQVIIQFPKCWVEEMKAVIRYQQIV